jgi:vancomycin permeability regulator SanA
VVRWSEIRGANRPLRGRIGAQILLTAWWRRARRLRIAGIAVLAAVTATTAAATAANARIVHDAGAVAYDDVTAVPHRRVAIVFGALVGPDGVPSPALTDRLQGAVDLFHAGRVDHLLMTGDNSRADYDEVSAMRAWALARGVPAEAITRDYAGLDTYDSCLRARTVFGVADAVLVTQAFHLPRALYLCRRQGIDAVGLSVADWQHHPERSPTVYPRDMQISYTVREWLARVDATVDTELRRRGPAVGGPYEGLRQT